MNPEVSEALERHQVADTSASTKPVETIASVAPATPLKSPVSTSKPFVYKNFVKHTLYTPKTRNIVATAFFGRELPLREIALKAKNAEYNPRRFPAVIMRMREPKKATILIFKSGKVVCTGAATEEDCKQACRAFAKNLAKATGLKLNFSKFEIHNMVGSSKTGYPLRL